MGVNKSDLLLYAVTDRSWLGGHTGRRQCPAGSSGRLHDDDVQSAAMAASSEKEEMRCLENVLIM